MKEGERILSSDFEKTVEEKIKKLRDYYQIYDSSDKVFETAYIETENIIARMPDSSGKQSAFAELYLLKYLRCKADGEFKDKIQNAAKSGGNADVICTLLIEEIIYGSDYTEMIKRINAEAVPLMEEMCYPCGKGMLLFWRGRAELHQKQMDLARESFKEAVLLIDKNNIYHAAALTALKCIDLMNENAEDRYKGFNAIAESYWQNGTKLQFAGQPGFSDGLVMHDRHKFDYIFYCISRFDGIFYDTSMEIGTTYNSRHKNAMLTVVTLHDTITVTAGTFKSCMRLSYICPEEYDADIWYSSGVGLVKVKFKKNNTDETYELLSYDIKGGSGYLPLCEGNRWRYIKPDLPDYLFQYYENEIDWTDGKRANFTVVRLVTLKKNYLDTCKLDSEICITACDKLCDEWRLGEAADMLRCAVRENTSQNAVMTALHGIDYLTRFIEYQRKSWRFCPSSMNASYLSVKNGSIMYEESGAYSFGPYRWGSRYEENRIFGVKPFRYLQHLFGRIYDEKWVPGYSETKIVNDMKAPAYLTVSDGGTVEVKAGLFPGCIKITISAEMKSRAPDYYFDDFRYPWCGTKEFWFAPGVGIVKFDCTWGTILKSSSELASFSAPAAGNAFMPVHIGNNWEYDEVNLTEEGYRAKRIIKVLCGMNDNYLIADAQEFLYQGTEEAYEAFKANLANKQA